MNNHNFLNEPTANGPLNEVAPIELPEGCLVRGINDLNGLVETPALPACQTFFNKNIRTISASANSKDTSRAYIDIELASLSDENRAIALNIGEPVILE